MFLMVSKQFLECLTGKVLRHLNLVDRLDGTVQSQAAGVDGKQHWLLLSDLARVHASAATVGERLRKRAWVHKVFVPAGVTSYLQP
eukprot:4354280-Amphidinium_carterae.2